MHLLDEQIINKKHTYSWWIPVYQMPDCRKRHQPAAFSVAPLAGRTWPPPSSVCAAWRAVEGKDIQFSPGQASEGHRHVTFCHHQSSRHTDWWKKVVFHYLAGLRYERRLCVPLSWFDIVNSNELFSDQYFILLFTKQARWPQDS